MRKPVVGDYLARNVESQSSQRIALVSVGLDAPIGPIHVFVDRGGDIHQCFAVFAQPLVLSPISDIGTESTQVIGVDQRLFNDVLYLFDRWHQTRKTDGATPSELDVLGG